MGSESQTGVKTHEHLHVQFTCFIWFDWLQSAVHLVKYCIWNGKETCVFLHCNTILSLTLRAAATVVLETLFLIRCRWCQAHSILRILLCRQHAKMLPLRCSREFWNHTTPWRPSLFIAPIALCFFNVPVDDQSCADPSLLGVLV